MELMIKLFCKDVRIRIMLIKSSSNDYDDDNNDDDHDDDIDDVPEPFAQSITCHLTHECTQSW